MTTPENAHQLDRLARDLPPTIRQIHERLHTQLHQLLPDALEHIDLPDRVLAFGTSERIRDTWFSLIAHKAHVNVQFADGVDLDDPAGLVEGTGKRIRHVKVRTVEDADRPALRALIDEQIRLRR